MTNRKETGGKQQPAISRRDFMGAAAVVAASSEAWGWLPIELTVPKAFGFEVATQSLNDNL